jgi:CubicO group peptidase (beta-lactamase class C family)
LVISYLKKMKTAAYLIVKNDSICREAYYRGYSDTSHTNAWSMEKSIVSLMLGVAIEEGKIKSVDEKVSDFIPSYNKGLDTLLTIKDLLTMSSGIHFGENYANPFGYPAKAIYGDNMMGLTLKYHCVDKPGSIFEYQTGNAALLAYILSKATGETLSKFTSEKLWKPIGAEHPAFWSVDKKSGIEKLFYSTARDFAKIGQLVLDSGKWNGKQIIPKQYIKASTKGQKVEYYGYQWWISWVGTHRVVYACGFSGQYIIIIPDENMVVVRLGEKDGNDDLSMYAGLAILLYGK